jgi:hypothetical protein
LAKIRKHKFFMAIIAVCALIILSMPFAAINIPNRRDAHSIGSITWDRWQMNRVDSILVKTSAGVAEIYDIAFINSIVRETMVAQATGFNAVYGEIILYLYRGNNLVRRMELCALHDNMRVYWSCTRHWFFLTSGWRSALRCENHGGGIAFLSRELADTIRQISKEIAQN